MRLHRHCVHTVRARLLLTNNLYAHKVERERERESSSIPRVQMLYMNSRYLARYPPPVPWLCRSALNSRLSYPTIVVPTNQKHPGGLMSPLWTDLMVKSPSPDALSPKTTAAASQSAVVAMTVPPVAAQVCELESTLYTSDLGTDSVVVVASEREKEKREREREADGTYPPPLCHRQRRSAASLQQQAQAQWTVPLTFPYWYLYEASFPPYDRGGERK